MTAALTWEDGERLICWRLARYARWREYDDLRQEARVRVWLLYRRAPPETSTIIVRAVDQAVAEYLRDPARSLCYSRADPDWQPPESLETLLAAGDPALAAGVDCEAAALAGLRAAELWEAMVAGATARQGGMLAAYYQGEETVTEIARAYRVTACRVYQVLDQGRKRARSRFDLRPERK